jgi:hypothetical protein
VCESNIESLSSKGKYKFVTVHDMKAYTGKEVKLHPFSTSALYVGKWPISCPCSFTSGERAALNRRLSVHKRRCRHFEEIILLPVTGIEPQFLRRPL